MKGKSPLMKALVGKQHNLNEGLKAAIKAAPGKMMQKSPMNMKEETAMKMGMVSPMKIAGMDDPERAKLVASLNAAKAKNPELYSDESTKAIDKAGKKQPVMTSPEDAPTPEEFKKLREDKTSSKPKTRKQEKLISAKAKEADFKAETKAPEIKRVADSDKPETRVMSKQEKKDLRQAKRSRARKGFAKGFREGFVSEITGDKVADIRKRTEERKTKREEEKKTKREALIAAASGTKG